ncbi:hypothetical protein TrVFT333_003249 [Trichoderma virens FT-333]|nr:hypothetical protein TrVFT333_003249 [Trichoderma virens FT-333]
MTTVEQFLEPPHGPEETGYILASIKNAGERHDSADCRYMPLAETIQEWLEFDVQNISPHSSMAQCLLMPCEMRWEPQIPRFARIIYSERQLEALYLQTLITRVNIALDHAIPSGEDRISIVVGPGAFESVSSEGNVERLLPDWIVVQGTFDISMKAASRLSLPDLARDGKILAVGDTKLIRKVGDDPIPHTKACYSDFMRQIQHYCINLYTQFGFMLSNEELVVAQLIREQEASPRGADQRGLRSRINGSQQLEPGLEEHDSQETASMGSLDEAHGHDNNMIDEPYPQPASPDLTKLPQRALKRPHASGSPGTSPVAAAAALRRDQYANRRLSGSDTSSSRQIRIPSDPPVSAKNYYRRNSHLKIIVDTLHLKIIAITLHRLEMLKWELYS